MTSRDEPNSVLLPPRVEGTQVCVASGPGRLAERDGALGELASQKRVADSLRLELKKAMQKAAMQQAQKGGEAS